jgi:hypothetical protein
MDTKLPCKPVLSVVKNRLFLSYLTGRWEVVNTFLLDDCVKGLLLDYTEVKSTALKHSHYP